MIAGCFLISSGKTLEIRDTETNKLYASWPVKDSNLFSIEFVHSVNQSPVKEVFAVDSREIRLVSVIFSSFGAGMQTDLAEGQELSRDDQGNMVISGYNQKMKTLNYIVGTVSDHIFSIEDEKVSLRKLCGKNAHITIGISQGVR